MTSIPVWVWIPKPVCCRYLVPRELEVSNCTEVLHVYFFSSVQKQIGYDIDWITAFGFLLEILSKIIHKPVQIADVNSLQTTRAQCDHLKNSTNRNIYRPQRSCGKVFFRSCLSVGGVPTSPLPMMHWILPVVTRCQDQWGSPR